MGTRGQFFATMPFRNANPGRLQLVTLVAAAGSLLSLFAVRAWSRLVDPPYMVDLRDLAERSPIVFRGRVSSVNHVWEIQNQPIRRNDFAVFQVDRWYRGTPSSNPSLGFHFDRAARNGHDCIDFQPDGYWIVFAVAKEDHLELIDDCSGALTVSRLLGPDLGNANWLPQMEADFLAGIGDNGPDGRLVSIQRLGGLGLASSRTALHRVIDQGIAPESKWAVYAALRTGDVTVLPKVRQLLANGDRDAPESAIALELQKTADPQAVFDLIAILDGSPGELTKQTVLTALGEKLRDPRALPSLAAHLSDPDSYARFDALVGLGNITREGACALPPGWTESDVEAIVLRCKTWWEREGKLRTWTRD